MLVDAVHAWRFTSVTLASAVTVEGRGGSTETKSTRRVFLPAASVRAVNVSTFFS
jgi:hypothetical protein